MFDFTSEGENLDEIEFEILILCKLSCSFYKNLHNFDENFNLKFTSVCTVQDWWNFNHLS